MTSNTDNIVFIIIFFLNFLLFYFLPTINGRGTLFGFVVRENEDDSLARNTLRKYRLGLLLIGAFFLAAIIGGILYFPKSLVFTYILSIPVSGFWLHVNFLRSWRMRKVETFSRFAAALKPRRLANFTNFWWEAVIVIFSLLPIAVLVYYYPQLPEKIPTHWNAAGEPNNWSNKNIISVFFPAFLNLYLQVFLLLTKSDIVTARFRVPAENAKQIMPLKEGVHLANINLMDWCRLMITLLFGVIALMLWFSTETIPISNFVSSVLIWLGIILLLGGAGFYAYQITLINRKIKEIAGQVVFQTAEENNAWTDGMFYKNDDDAAFFIEKANGTGYTINMANKRAYLYIAMIAGLMAFTILLLILLKD